MDSRRSEGYELHRRDVARQLMETNPEALVVTGLGATTWDVAAAGDRDSVFPLWGAMGGAAMVGLGLALAQPERRVLVITGDGEQIMGLGALVVLGAKQPTNLALVVLDNERYGETGMQTTHTAGRLDLAAAAAAAGIGVALTLRNAADLKAGLDTIARTPGPIFADIKVRAEDLPLVLPPKDGAYLKDRFRGALLGREQTV